MGIVGIVVVGVVSGILAVTVKKTNPEISLQISVAAGCVILMMCMDYLKKAVGFMRDFSEKLGAGLAGIEPVLKIIGIAYLCEFAVQALKDSGESAIAAKVELGGKLVMIVMTMPLFTQFVDLVMQMTERI